LFWRTITHSSVSRLESCATPSSRSGVARTSHPTGTNGSTWPSPCTGTCTFPGPPGTTASGSRRCRSAARASGGGNHRGVDGATNFGPPGMDVGRIVGMTG
jgi:hypothetical protein